MGKFVIRKASNGEHYFNLKADNGKNILTSERYTTKAACYDGVGTVKKNSKDDSNYSKEKSNNDEYYFNLKAGNEKVIGTSEMYETSSGRDNGIESVKDNAPDADVVEE
jgi:uncharacterized protein YegP (UPF0339 family)